MIEIRCTLYLPTDWKERACFKVWNEGIVRGGFHVRPGRWTDFASVPWWARSIFPPIDRYALSALAHDCALADGLGWRTANDIFHRGLMEDGIPTWRRILIMAAVQTNATFQRTLHAVGLGGRYV